MPSFKGQLIDQADRRRHRLRGEGDRRQRERLTLCTSGRVPARRRVVATDFDRTLVWEDGVLRPRTLAALRRRRARAGLHVIVVTGRMVQSVRRALEPAQLDEPVICYQGAVVADGDGQVAAARADPARARARGDRALVEGGLRAERLRRRRALRRGVTAGRARLREFQHLDDPRRRRRARLARASRRRSSCCVGDPAALDALERRAEGALRRPALHLEVAAVLPRVRARRA